MPRDGEVCIFFAEYFLRKLVISFQDHLRWLLTVGQYAQTLFCDSVLLMIGSVMKAWSMVEARVMTVQLFVATRRSTHCLCAVSVCIDSCFMSPVSSRSGRDGTLMAIVVNVC